MSSSSSPALAGLRYLFWCAHEHLDFRVPEFESVARIFGVSLDWAERSERTRPWVVLRLGSEADARKILSRSISAKYCIELWGEGRSPKEMHEALKRTNLERLTLPHRRSSFKIYVEAFMRKLSLEERLARIESFSYLPLEGPVRLKEPDLVLSCFEFYGLDHNNLPDEPERVFFGRCIGEQQQSENFFGCTYAIDSQPYHSPPLPDFIGEGQRSLVTRLSIKSRRFIGNTTMDPQLSLLMANLSCARDGDLVLDPFVGTGSLTLACAQFGARVLGGDIDFLMLHAR